jgi:HTH-type transcriptional regulator/antitoxin HipB
MNDASAKEIGDFVRFNRKQSGLSQFEFAKVAGIGKTSVFDIEKGKPTVRLATLLAALRALNIRIKLCNLPAEEAAPATEHTREDWKNW